MHLLEANASLAGRFFTAKCRQCSRLQYFGCFSRYYWGRISQNINV